MSEILILLIILIILMIWSTFWKGLACYEAGKRKEKLWFVILFIVNTIGILDIIYLLTRKKMKKSSK